LFTFQIYCDFSGYSDIAIGTSRLFGFDIMKNFNFPYFSRDIAEFWRRWHISLSTWFRDYLYIPLGGSRCSRGRQIFNTFVVFTVSGFWHGANWTFVVWGALNAVYFLPLLLSNKNRVNLDIIAYNRVFPTFRELRGVIITFSLTVFAWIFFRAENISHAISYIRDIFTWELFSIPKLESMREVYILILSLLVFVVIEWIGRRGNYAIEKISLGWKKIYRWSFYYVLILVIIFRMGQEQQFIYFQF